MNNYKRYAWNRNAATHRDALLRFAVFASMFAGAMAIMVSIAFQPVNRTAETYRTGAIVAVLTAVICFAAVFLLLTLFYIELNRETETRTPPTPPKTPQHVGVDYWQNGKYRGKI